VAGDVVQGAIKAYATHKFLTKQKASNPLTVRSQF
jgi:hypothetical protein